LASVKLVRAHSFSRKLSLILYILFLASCLDFQLKSLLVTLFHFVPYFSSSLNCSRSCSTLMFVPRNPSASPFQVREARVSCILKSVAYFDLSRVGMKCVMLYLHKNALLCVLGHECMTAAGTNSGENR